MAEFNLSKSAGGVPVWVWIVGGTVTVGGAYFIIRGRQQKNAASQATSTQGTAPTTPATSGDFSTDQAEAIFSDIRNLQGQESQFAGTASSLSNQLTATGTSLGQQIARIPSGPAGAPGPAGTPGTQGNPGPPGPPAPPPVRPPSPQYHEAVVHTDGRRSINFYASQYNTSVGNILAATKRSEPSDYNRASSLLHKYINKGAWSNVLPAGYTLYVPYYR